jgi:hypothetical protein
MAPQKILYVLDGRLRMKELPSVGNLMDTGHLNITVWSYSDRFTFSVLMRKGAMPQPDGLLVHPRRVVAELRSNYLDKTDTPEKRQRS